MVLAQHSQERPRGWIVRLLPPRGHEGSPRRSVALAGFGPADVIVSCARRIREHQKQAKARADQTEQPTPIPTHARSALPTLMCLQTSPNLTPS